MRPYGALPGITATCPLTGFSQFHRLRERAISQERGVTRMTDSKKTKKQIQLCGSLLSPLAIGEPAVFRSGGIVYRTSRVTAVHQKASDGIRFETREARYHLLLPPCQTTVLCRFPMELSACA